MVSLLFLGIRLHSAIHNSLIALLCPDPYQHLAGRLEAVRYFELAHLLLNFSPSQLTISVVESAHKFANITGRISHTSNSVSSGWQTSLYRNRMNRHIEKTGPTVDVFKRPRLSEGAHPGFSWRRRGYVSYAANNCEGNPMVRIPFFSGKYYHCDFASRLHHAAHLG